jgi:hypothetical protein
MPARRDLDNVPMRITQSGPLIDAGELFVTWHDATDLDEDETDFTMYDGKLTFYEDVTIGTSRLIAGHKAVSELILSLEREWGVEISFDRVKRLGKIR